MLYANKFASKRGKILRMHDIGAIVKNWRTDPRRNLSVSELALRVGTSRQNIENLESGAVEVPKYICALADVLETTTDALLGRTKLSVREPDKPWRVSSPEEVLDALSSLIAGAVPEMRSALGEALAGFVRESGSPYYRVMVLALLNGQR